jgi:hypothetical protein
MRATALNTVRVLTLLEPLQRFLCQFLEIIFIVGSHFYSFPVVYNGFAPFALLLVQPCPRKVCLCEIGFRPNRFVEVRKSLVCKASVRQEAPQVPMAMGIIRLDLDSMLEVFDSLIILSAELVQQSAADVSVLVIRVNVDGSVKVL